MEAIASLLTRPQSLAGGVVAWQAPSREGIAVLAVAFLHEPLETVLPEVVVREDRFRGLGREAGRADEAHERAAARGARLERALGERLHDLEGLAAALLRLLGIRRAIVVGGHVETSLSSWLARARSSSVDLEPALESDLVDDPDDGDLIPDVLAAADRRARGSPEGDDHRLADPRAER